MKRFLAVIFAALISATAFGQWVSPGDGTTYTMTSLSTIAPAAVSSPQSGQFQIHQNITISANDTLFLESDANDILINNNITLTIFGTLLTEPRVNHLFITGDSTGTSFFTLQLDNASTANLSYVVFQYGQKIQLFNSGLTLFDNCVFTHFSDAVINYMNCNPTIQNCYFHDNQKAAITSAVNTTGSPKIINNLIENNDLSNANVPQINIGPGSEDTIVIAGNQIEGVAQNMSGGIGIMNMGTSNTVLLVSNNVIENNRYGYTQNGTNIYAIIQDNIIRNNNLETNPNNGGSGISIYGMDENNKAYIRNNVITNNHWGITVINAADVDLGTEDNWGHNVIHGNGHVYNYGANYGIFDLYNNSAYDITAVGNYWGTIDEQEIEEHITHQFDDPSLGLVYYIPFLTEDGVNEVKTTGFEVWPNPVSNGSFTLTLENAMPTEVTIYNVNGQMVKSQIIENQINTISIEALKSGVYFVEVKNNESKNLKKIIIQ